MKHVIGRLLTFYTQNMSHFIIGVAINFIQILIIILAVTGYDGLEPAGRVLIAVISAFLQVMYNARNYVLADNSIKEFEKEYQKKYPIVYFGIDMNKAWEKEQD